MSPLLLVLWATTAALVVGGLLPVSQRRLHRWSVRFNVLLDDPDLTGALAGRLRRARAIRWTTFAVGLNIGLLTEYMNKFAPERAAAASNPLTTQAPFAAAALGALVAELSLTGSPRGVRTATVTPRRWSDYTDRFWLVFVVATVPVSLLCGLIVAGGTHSEADWWWVAPAASALAVAAITVGVHYVVNRPASATDEPTRRIDDALRADGVHHIIGAAVALGGMAACWAMSAALGSHLLGLVPASVTYAVLGCWYGIACTTVWNVDQARMQHRMQYP